MKDTSNYRIGDLVLVIDEQLPRGQWPLALIKEVRLGRDDRVRSVRLRLKAYYQVDLT